jgi:hypothetical protein
MAALFPPNFHGSLNRDQETREAQGMRTLGPDNAVYVGDGDWIAYEDFGDEDGDITFSSTLAELEWIAEIRRRFPKGDPVVVKHFLRLHRQAVDYFDQTERHLDIYGALGELYAAARYGLRLHRAKAQGSDGRVDNDFIEVKTIGPENATRKVWVKLTGNFNHLVIVRIAPDFTIESRKIPRDRFARGSTGRAGIAWSRAEALEQGGEA